MGPFGCYFSLTYIYRIDEKASKGNKKRLVLYLSGGCWGRSLHLPGADGFEESDHVTAEVPLPLLKRCVEEQSGVLSAHCWNLHVLYRKAKEETEKDGDWMSTQ